MEAGMRPIGYASHPSVFYGVPMDIIHVTVEVDFITDEVSQKRRCHQARSPRLARLCEMRPPFLMARENCPLIGSAGRTIHITGRQRPDAM